MTPVLIICAFLVAIGVTVVVMLIVTSSNRANTPSSVRDDDRDDELAPVTHAEKKAHKKAERIEEKRLPYRHMEPDGLFIVHGKSVWTGITLPSVTDEHMSEEALTGTALRQVHFLTTIARHLNARTDFHLRVVGRETAPEEWARGVIRKAPDPTGWYAKTIHRMAHRLGGQGEREIVRVLMVRLGTTGKSETATGKATATVTGVTESTLSAAEREQWRQRAREVHMAATSSLGGATPTDRQTLVWLIRKPLHGHLPIGEAPHHGSRPWGPGAFQLIAGMGGLNLRDHLLVTQHDSTGQDVHSYTAAVVVADRPETEQLRKSSAMVRHALAFAPGADLSWRFSMVPPAQMREMLTGIRTNLEDEDRNMSRAHAGTDAHLRSQLARASAAEAQASANDTYGLLGSPQFILSAPTRRELDDKITEFVLHMGNISLDVVRPRRLQYRLIEAAMPGDAPRSAVAPWERLTDPDMFALAMPSAGTDLGDRVSYDRDGRTPLGWVGRQIGYHAQDGSTVFNDLHSALARNKAGGVAVIGSSGSGKSFFVLSTCIFETEAGRPALVIDPKEDFASMIYYLSFGPQVNLPGFAEEAERGTLGLSGSRFQPVWREFWEETDVIDLARSRDGILDPFVVARSVAEGVLLARTFLDTVMTPEQARVCSRYIETALEDVAFAHERAVAGHMQRYGVSEDEATGRVPRPAMSSVVEQLDRMVEKATQSGASEGKVDDIAYAVKVMRGLARQPFSRLAFGVPGAAGIAGLRKRRTIVTMRGFPTPTSSDPAQWRPDMRAGAGAMLLVLEVGNAMLTNDGLSKLVIIDEAHIPLAFPDGRGMMRKGVRVGRSTDTVTVLVSQQAIDLKRMEEESEDGEGANQFHEVFVFRQKTTTEAKPAVALLGLDPEDPHAQRSVQEPNLDTGVCVMRDADNRTGTVVIDQLWHELRSATETNPDRRRTAQSRPFNPDVDTWTWADDPDPHSRHAA